MNFGINSELYNEVALNGLKIRGYFINEIISLERLIDQFIAKSITTDVDMQHELVAVIFGTKRIGFESKRRILIFILKKYHQELNKANPTVGADLKKIEDYRNTFAHCVLDTTPESIENVKNGKIGFIEIENDIHIVYYEQEELNNLRDMVSKYKKIFFNQIYK